MNISIDKLKDLLVNPGHISEADFENGKNEAQKRKIDLEKFLVEKGLISDENLGQTIADGFDHHFIDLKKVKISDDLLSFIPEVVARSQQAVVFERVAQKHENTGTLKHENTKAQKHENTETQKHENTETLKHENTETQKHGNTETLKHDLPAPAGSDRQAGNTKTQEQGVLKIATSNLDNYEFFKLLEKKTGCKIEIYYATPLGIEDGLKYYKSDLGEQVKELIENIKTKKQKNNKTIKQKDMETLGEENIVKLVNLFLEYAHDNRASDIHIEPMEKNVSVRFRIDGILHEALEYPKELHDKIVFRIKIMARLRTDEHAATQDGRFDYKIGGARFDIRVSMMPITNGENVVMRLLAESSQRLSIEDLGLLGTDFKKVKRAAEKPYGMILSVGPTGSGKTTTLYSILQILNKPEVNIMTIEDPVEYNVEHIQQTQVNAKKNLTFATGLRSIVRQDPDIIMVGEIRDNETASIAVNAAMTGHLVLSTLHANDAATVFPRLIDMGIEPFLVSSSVNVIVAQRLSRKICEKCRVSYEVNTEAQKHGNTETLKHENTEAQKHGNTKTQEHGNTETLKHDLPAQAGNTDEENIIEQLPEEIRKKFFNKDKIILYRGTGCKICGDTGYSGRTGIFEVMELTEEIKSLITQKASADIIEKKAKELGMTSMLYDGLTKVLQGITTLEEVIRATKT